MGFVDIYRMIFGWWSNPVVGPGICAAGGSMVQGASVGGSMVQGASGGGSELPVEAGEYS